MFGLQYRVCRSQILNKTVKNIYIIFGFTFLEKMATFEKFVDEPTKKKNEFYLTPKEPLFPLDTNVRINFEIIYRVLIKKMKISYL